MTTDCSRDRRWRLGDHPCRRSAIAVRHTRAPDRAAGTRVDWFKPRRLLGPLGDVPPAEFGAQNYAQAAVA